METAVLGLDEEQAGEEDEGRGSEEEVEDEEDEMMEEWYALEDLIRSCLSGKRRWASLAASSGRGYFISSYMASPWSESESGVVAEGVSG